MAGILTVFGARLLLPYYYFQAAPLWGAISWGTVFIALNLYWIATLFLERRLFEAALKNMDEHEARELFDLAEVRVVETGRSIMTEGGPVSELSLIVTGSVDVFKSDRKVDTMDPGRFLGSIAFLADRDDFRAPVTVAASQSVRILTWPIAELRKRFSSESGPEIGVRASLRLELARLLLESQSELAKGLSSREIRLT